jgi:hypothetical protein
MTLEEKYELARDQIKHEDGLINNRVTWVLIFHGLLFGAIFQPLSLFGEAALLSNQKFALIVGLCLLCSVGLGSSIVAASAVASAHLQIAAVNNWWKNQAGDQHELPPLMGKQGIRILGLPVSGAMFLHGLALVWLALLVLLGWSACCAI